MRKLLSSLSVLLLFIGNVLAQERTITGTVTAQEDGLPLPGVSVRVKGTGSGTQTGANGNFSLRASGENPVLVFTYIGYTTQEVNVGTRSTVNVTLVSDAQQLGEVVVTALGVSRAERSIGYSVSEVSGEALVRSGEQNVIQGLAAKASGVQVTSSAGTPGASSKIVLRGPASFSGDNQPLIVIDGVPVNNDVNNITAGDDPYNGNLYGVQLSNRAIDINPEDIESVSILKGPAAAALYGQAAGNGAIIYTTKRGRARNGVGITFSSSVEFQNVNKLPELQNRYGQGASGAYTNATPNSWGPDLLAAGTPIFDNTDAFFKTGTSYNNNISLNGGNEKTAFRVSFGSTNINGIIPNSGYDRYTVRLTGDSELSSRIKVGGTVNYTNSSATRSQNGSNLAGVMLPLLRMPIGFDINNYQNPDGTNNNYFASYDNPLFSAYNNPYTDETDRIFGNIYGDAKLNNTFTLSLKVGSDAYGTVGNQIYAFSSRGNDYGDGSGQMNRTNVSFRNLYSDLLLKFNKKFGTSPFTISGLVGGNINYTQFQSSFQRGRDISIPNFYNFSSFKELYVSNNDTYRNSQALLADVTLDYGNILFLTLTGRNEWSTTFGKNSKGFFYPKADLSYVFSHLVKNQDILSYGKVRLAYSNVGIAPGVYDDRTYFTTPTIADGMTNGFSFPYMGQNGYAISNVISGFGLVPERNIGREVGLELKFLNGRIGLDATYYNQTSRDLLITQPVASTSGFAYKYNNIGKIRNTGVELGLNGDVFKGKDFAWNAAVNWSTNDNEVLELAPGVTELSVGSGFSDPQSFAIVGKPFGVFYMAKFQRDAQGNLLINPSSGLPLKEATQSEVGSPLPDWLMNINNSFSYKNVSFSFLWDIRQGGDIWNGTWQNLNFRGRTKESEARDQTYVIPGVYASGANAGQPNTTQLTGFQYYSNYLGGGGQSNELSVQDGSWIRLRSINLSYRFDTRKVLPKSSMQYIELGANMRNVLLFTDYKGVDPETSLTGSDQNLSGLDYFNNPSTRSLIFNLRVGF
ncbi:SusC/RagA family TonB-linked outer membrane protein [Pedobacter sp. SYSU D00535]|uniref:SusC/RagA family TonB-linked outer membrane protein n=1 Tax=Pedobacter sp. SYSU D00535 TaxID=2810308 RepID=UPI001A96F08C|nr:SusC/RagA family TonB-linked outer membrane protein [Pedobacter sp. SYSU D00535]